LENDLYRQIWSYGYGQNVGLPFVYQLNTQFFGYAHDLIIGNYQSKGAGLPPDAIVIPDWSFDYTFLGNSVSLAKSGTGHAVGELYLEGGYVVGVPYVWNVFFDSNEDGDIVLPNIPEALQDYPLYNSQQNYDLELGRVGLRKYDNLNTYDEFLEQELNPTALFKDPAPDMRVLFPERARHS
jgi:hypothetical protein